MVTLPYGGNTMGMPIRSVKIPDKLWKQIPTKNKSAYIRDAIRSYGEAYGESPYDKYIDQKQLIGTLHTQIEDIIQERDRYRNKAEIQDIALMSFFPRRKYKKLLLMAPKKTEK